MASAVRTTHAHSPAGRAGFTIMELMIVLVIIGIMAMTVAPSLSEVLGNNRQSNATMELVRFGRNARARALSSGAAQLVVFVAADSGGHGRFQLYSGSNNKCLQVPWAQAAAKRQLSFDMLDYNHGTNPRADDPKRPVIKATAKADNTLDQLQLCYQPDGLVYAAFNSLDPTQLRIQDLDVEVTITRTLNGAVYGADRKVVFPMGGNVRVQ